MRQGAGILPGHATRHFHGFAMTRFNSRPHYTTGDDTGENDEVIAGMRRQALRQMDQCQEENHADGR